VKKVLLPNHQEVPVGSGIVVTLPRLCRVPPGTHLSVIIILPQNVYLGKLLTLSTCLRRLGSVASALPTSGANAQSVVSIPWLRHRGWNRTSCAFLPSTNRPAGRAHSFTLHLRWGRCCAEGD